jgi:peptide/nickel transport system substrate-binding protein
VAQQLSKLIYAPLFVIGDNLLPVPYLAERAVQKDALTYQVILRKNLFFHNGDKLEAKDVVYTFENPGQAEVKAPIISIKALSSQVVEFKLKTPYAPLLSELSGLGIVSAKPTGSGPYRIKSHNSATETWVFEAFEQWFEGQPKIKNIEVRVVRDGNSRVLELIKGKADFLSGYMRPFQLSALDEYQDKLRIEKTAGLDYMYFAMNLRKPPLSDVRVRQAIAMGLNIDPILKAKFKGMASRATGMLPSGHWAKDESLKPIEYNPEKARQLLKKAGYKLPIKLTLLVGTDRFRQSIALLYRHQLAKIGIQLDLRIADAAVVYQSMRQGQFELFTAIWTPVVEPNLFDWVFHSSRIPTQDKAGGNRGAYVDPELDKLIEQAQATSNIAERKVLYAKIERRLLETLPYIPLWFEDNITVTNRRLVGFVPTRTCSFLPLTRAHLEAH